ncbi:PRTRC system protein E [Rugamonas aquatica]|nr:PRTRC system protein E [Rugamonas aquatica]
MLFQELYALACRSTLSMLVDANADTGLMTISVRPQPKGGHAACATCEPLTLTATPAEFDTGFAGAFATYRTVLGSLQAQADAAAEQLRSKSAKPTAKPTTRHLPGTEAAPTKADWHVQDGDVHGQAGQAGQQPAALPVKAPVAPAQPSLFD